jgi:hypothetical protein
LIKVGQLPNTPLKELVKRIFAEEEWTEEEIKIWERRFGRLDMRFNPLSNDEDFWLPQRA